MGSLVIAELTLALVWVELSKRPELQLGNFTPMIYTKILGRLAYKAGHHDEPPKPSRILGVAEINQDDLQFDDNFSFAIDLSNIGYQEIMVHEYVVHIDGKREKPVALGGRERLKLMTQGRHTIDLRPLGLGTPGLHKVRLEVFATTLYCVKEVWFYTMTDLKTIRYTEMYPLKAILSHFIKRSLADP